MEDQERFAALSGDYNPLHVDAQAARRTMLGAPVVHGVHLLLWALDLANLARSGQPITELTVAFRRPAYLGEELTLHATPDRPGVLTGTIDGEVSLEVTVSFAEGAHAAHPEASRAAPAPDSWPSRVAPDEPDPLSLPKLEGELPLTLDPRLLRAMFPRLAEQASPWELADLLATTRLVGMHCPGLHSLYSGLRLKRVTEGARARAGLGWRVAQYHPKYSTLKLAVQGAALEGTLDTFVRPLPQKPLAMAEIVGLVKNGEFAGQRALVVGGSRGIGEAFSKVIGAGGGQVLVTYRSGRAEAEGVCRDIVSHGGRAEARLLDVTSKDPSAVPALEGGITHLYYFATPFIRIQRGKLLDHAAFLRFLEHYVFGLQHTIEAVQSVSSTSLLVYAPSTVFLDTTERGAAAYCAAKAAMEELARHWSQSPSLRVVTPRLPKMRTDQTAALVTSAAADPIQVALHQLRSLAALSPAAE